MIYDTISEVTSDLRHAVVVSVRSVQAVGYRLVELSAASPTGATELERLVSIARAVPHGALVHLVEVARLMADCDTDYQFELGA